MGAPPPRRLLPLVFLPGMLATCKQLETLSHEGGVLRYAGVPTFCLEGFARTDGMDNSAVEAATFLTPLREQAARIRAQVLRMPQLERGFHMSGFSQGGLLARIYTQLYNTLPPADAAASAQCAGSSCGGTVVSQPFRVVSLFSLHSPQGGISQMPSSWGVLLTVPFGGPSKIYTAAGQRAATFLSFAKDCSRLAEYRASSVLAELNNEADVKQPLYAERLRNLRTFVMAGSSVDGVIVPPESQMFGFDACDAAGYGDADDVVGKGSNGDAAADADAQHLGDLSAAAALLARMQQQGGSSGEAEDGGTAQQPFLSLAPNASATAEKAAARLLPIGALGSGLPLRRSRAYREDWMGLRSLDEKGRLVFWEDGFAHAYTTEPSQEAFRLFDAMVPYLNVTIEQIEAEEHAERQLNARGRSRQRAALQARR